MPTTVASTAIPPGTSRLRDSAAPIAQPKTSNNPPPFSYRKSFDFLSFPARLGIQKKKNVNCLDSRIRENDKNLSQK